MVEKLVEYVIEAIAKQRHDVGASGARGSQVAAKAKQVEKCQRLISNMLARGVAHASKIKLLADGMPDSTTIKLSHVEARVLLQDPAAFGPECGYKPLLDGVLSSSHMFAIDVHLRSALDCEQDQMSEYDIVSSIWRTFADIANPLRSSDPAPEDLKFPCPASDIYVT